MLSVFFLLLLLLVSGLGRTGTNRVRMFRRLLPRTRLISTGIVSLDTLEQNLRRTCLVSLKVFCVRVWHALCFTEKGNGGNQRICGILLFNHQKHIFTSTIPLATKLDSLVTYIEGLLAIKSHDPAITQSCKITWQIKNISPLPQYLWPPNFSGSLHTMSNFHIRLHGHLIMWPYEVSW